MRHRVRLLVVCLALALVMTGCAKRYRITDLQTGDVYYSAEFRPKRVTDTGRAVFVDAATGAVIRLDEWEAKRIGKRAFRRAVEDDGQ